jgi:hypothetical protein
MAPRCVMAMPPLQPWWNPSRPSRSRRVRLNQAYPFAHFSLGRPSGSRPSPFNVSYELMDRTHIDSVHNAIDLAHAFFL